MLCIHLDLHGHLDLLNEQPTTTALTQITHAQSHIQQRQSQLGKFNVSELLAAEVPSDQTLACPAALPVVALRPGCGMRQETAVNSSDIP